uniref:EGF-like domain-containing protein n=1 Tax=Strongyloides papillosus TaxID=174720 RepID=A0A0N5C2A6_STREA
MFKYLNTLFIVFSIIINLMECSKFCIHQDECIEKIKKLTGDVNLFWFGDEWRTLCDHRYFKYQQKSKSNPIDCLNPPNLSKFHSLGSRLFQVPTFSSHFLDNLKIFPRVTFFPKPGNYTACDHDFNVDTGLKKEVHGHPEMVPLDSFFTITPPDLNWPGLGIDDTRYTVLITDPSEGKIIFLSTNFPYETRKIIEYNTLKPYRDSPSPMVFLIFKQEQNDTELNFIPQQPNNNKDLENDSSSENTFDLPEFMLKNNLTTKLVGLTWSLIKTDPYSIEVNRQSNGVDNCHSLLIKKLQKEHTFDFVPNFNLNELDNTVSLSYYQPSTEFKVCCEKFTYDEDYIMADPLAYGYIPSLSLINKPKLKMIKNSNFIDNYQRIQRHYVIRKDEKFIVIMFEPNKKRLFWLVSDVTSGALANGDELDGTTIFPYEDPSSFDPDSCNEVVLMILEESRHGKRINIRRNREDENINESSPSQYDVKMIQNYFTFDQQKVPLNYFSSDAPRQNFSIENFKSYMKIKLTAITWFESCYDEFNAITQIRQVIKSNLTEYDIKNKFGKLKINKIEYYGYPRTPEVQAAKTQRLKRELMVAICKSLKPSFDNTCKNINNSIKIPINYVLTMGLLLITLLKKY